MPYAVAKKLKKERIRKQPKCLSTDERIKKWVYIRIHTHTHTHTVEYSWVVLLSVTKSCLALCNPTVYSLTGSSVHGIIQARILEWVAISSSRGSSGPRDWTCMSGTGRWILYHWATWEAHSGILFSHKKGWKLPICSNMDRLGGCYTKWIKSKTYYMLSFVCGILKLQ